MMNLEINTAVPHGELARSLADKLRFYIADTPVPVGGRLPSNREIARAANVSQVTARMAVLALAREGLLESRSGCGTYVVRAPSQLPLARGGKPKKIGIVLSPWDSESEVVWNNRDVLAEVVGNVSAAGKLTIFTYEQWLEYAAGDPNDMIRENELDTLVWFYVGYREIAFVARLEQQEFRQLLIHRRPFGLHSPVIRGDNAAGINRIFDSLSAGERERLLILSGDPTQSVYSTHYAAIAERMGREPTGDELLILPLAPFPRWTALVLREELTRLRPRAVIDLAGYINPLSALGETFHRSIGSPRLFSFTLPTAWQAEHKLHYTFLQPEWGAAAKTLREFFLAREIPETTVWPLKLWEF